MRSRGNPAFLLLLAPVLVGFVDCADAPETHDVVSTDAEAVAELDKDYKHFLQMYRQYVAEEPVDIPPGSTTFRTFEGLRIGAPQIEQIRSMKWEFSDHPADWCGEHDGMGTLHLDAEIRVSKKKTADEKVILVACTVDEKTVVKPKTELSFELDLERTAMLVDDAFKFVQMTYDHYEEDIDSYAMHIESASLKCPKGFFYTKAAAGENTLSAACEDADGKRNGPYREHGGVAKFVKGEFKLSGQYENGEKTGTWTTFDDKGEAAEKTEWKADKEVK